MAAVNEEAGAARSQVNVGRAILVSGAVFFVLKLSPRCSITTVHALPLRPDVRERGRRGGQRPRPERRAVWRFTGDQIAGALFLDIPEIYNWHFGELQNATHSRLFTDFVFAFRAMLGWVGLATVMTSLRGLRFGGRKKKKA